MIFDPELIIIPSGFDCGAGDPIGRQMMTSEGFRSITKKMMRVAEDIVMARGLRKVAIISGVGVREYYENRGYKLYKNYMIKSLIDKREFNLLNIMIKSCCVILMIIFYIINL